MNPPRIYVVGMLMTAVRQNSWWSFGKLPAKLFEQLQGGRGGPRAEAVVMEVDTNHLYAIPYPA